MTRIEREFVELLQSFDTAMLATRQPDGTLRARPMAVARAQTNGDLWFVTAIDGKVEEAINDPDVLATFQTRDRYLSVSGQAEVVGDQGLIDRVWRDEWRTWFPQGKEDPRLVLIHLRAREAEYWDESSTHGARWAFQKARATFEGRELHRQDAEHHGHVYL